MQIILQKQEIEKLKVGSERIQLNLMTQLIKWDHPREHTTQIHANGLKKEVK